MTVEVLHVALTLAGAGVGWWIRHRQDSPLVSLLKQLLDDHSKDQQAGLLAQLLGRIKRPDQPPASK